MRRLFISFFFLTSFISLIQSQCVLNELIITPKECNVSGQFFVQINFNHSGNSDSFRLLGNGINYGIFPYESLPITIGPLQADCTTNYEFVVRDQMTENCVVAKNLGKKCCEDNCKIAFADVKAGACNDNKYNLSFDLKYNAPPNGFDLYNNGQLLGYYQYSQLPLRLENVISSTNEQYNTLVVCANDDKTCCDTIKILNPCICNIYKIRGQVVNCNNDSSSFDLRLDFKHQLTSDSFQVGGNTMNYGKFAYGDLPITIKNLKFSDITDYEFLIVDKNDVFCFGSYPLGKVTECRFDCNIDDVIAKPTDCIDGSFYVNIQFKEKNTSLEGFVIRGNGVVYDTFQYGESSYKIGPLKGDCTTLYEFAVKDLSIDGCGAVIQFTEPVCCDAPDCKIYDLSAVPTACNDDQQFYVKLKFKTIGHGNDGFILKVNGSFFDTLPYGKEVYEIGPLSADCETLYHFLLQDVNHPDCAHDIRLQEKVCCNDSVCKLSNLSIKEFCESSQLKAYEINFDHVHTNSGTFVLRINNILIGRFLYSQLPLKLDTFPFVLPKAVFRIFDSENEACNLIKEYNFECAKLENCSIRDAVVVAGDCNDNGEFYVKLKFISSNVSSRGFIVKVNNNYFDSLKYGKDFYEIGPLKGDCNTFYNFTIEDLDHPECSTKVELKDKICCDSVCQLKNLTIKEFCIDNQLKAYEIDFDHIHTNSATFVLRINNILIGRFLYSQLPLKLDSFPFTLPKAVIKIFDSENEACNLVKEYTFECGKTTSCDISALTVTARDCNNDGMFYAVIKFTATNPGSAGFVVKVNGIVFDSLKYGKEGYEIGPLKGDCITLYKFIVQDINHPDCLEDVAFTEKICCGDCTISNPLVTFSDCNDGTYHLTLNFDHVNTLQKFRIKVNGVFKGPYNYDDLPIVIENLKERIAHEIIIYDTEKETCRYVLNIPAIECIVGTEDALIYQVTLANDNQYLRFQLGQSFLPSNIYIYNVSGHVVHSQPSGMENEIEIGSLPAGLYFLSFNTNIKVVTKKFIKY